MWNNKQEEIANMLEAVDHNNVDMVVVGNEELYADPNTFFDPNVLADLDTPEDYQRSRP